MSKDKRIQKKLRRVAFVTKNWLGDIIMQTPAIHMIRENYPDAEIIGFVPERCHGVLANNPDVDRLIAFHERENVRSIWQRMQFIQRTRRENIDEIFFFHRSFARALLFAMSGIPRRAGFRTKRRGWLLTNAIKVPALPMHQADYALHLLSKAGLELPGAKTFSRFHPSVEDRSFAENLLAGFGIEKKNYVVIHPGANWSPKRWPPEHFALLADYLFDKYRTRILITGGSTDLDLARTIYQSTRCSQPTVLTNKTSLGVLGAIFEQAQLVISGDSGPMHIAAGVGAPLLALFLATDAGFTGPRNSAPTLIIQKASAIRSDALSSRNDQILRVSEVTPESVLAALENSQMLGKETIPTAADANVVL